jgi:RNA polymerase sigma factor (sigma-70 family)
MHETDLELLRRYGREGAEDAFTEIVRRHLGLVYSAALRQVRSPQLAEEIAQSAFTDLARNSQRLAPDTVLAAWLYQVTRRTAIDVVRRETRRQAREQIATEMNATPADAAWLHIEPLLDEAMDELDDTDRAAVLLRYFENKSLREVGQTLGVSDDAAQKRVSRAIERLREFFAKRGVAVGAGGLAAIISANAIQAAPVGLAATISAAAAVIGTTTAATATATAAKAIAMTALQKTIIVGTVAVLSGVGIYESRQASQLRDQVQLIQEQQAPLAGQIEQLRQERDRATNALTAVRAQIDQLNGNTVELLRLRAEVTSLRQRPNQPGRLTTENPQPTMDLSDRQVRMLAELRTRYGEAKTNFLANWGKVRQLAAELNVPAEITTNVYAFTNASAAGLAPYQSYFDAVKERDLGARWMDLLVKKFVGEILDAEP